MTVIDQQLSETTPSDPQKTILERITLEHALYALITIAAAVLRILDLDGTPLSPQEAQEALNVWDFWQLRASESIGSPGFFTITGLLSQVLGWSDHMMRLVPILFGIGLVLLPWFLRHRSGRIGSLTVSLLLAVSPTLVVISRTAGGQSVALFAGLLLFISWLQYQESENDRWFITFALALVLGLVSDRLFYSLSFTLAIAWLVQRILGPSLIKDEGGRRKAIIWPNWMTIRFTVLIWLGFLILFSTAFLLRPDGLGATADLAVEWFSRFVTSADLVSWISPFFAIMRYEFALLILGIPAVIWAFRHDQSYPLFLVYWLLASLLLLLFQRGEMANIVLFGLACSLLIGCLVNDVLGSDLDWRELVFAVAFLVASGIIYVNLARYGRLASTSLASLGTYNLLLIIATLITVIVLIAILWNWNKAVTQKSLIVGALILMVFLSWSTAWWLSRTGAGDTRERWYTQAADDDLYSLSATAQELSWQIANSSGDIQILSTIEDPSLRWYLRDFPNLIMEDALLPSANDQLIITPSGQNPALENEYIGTDFGYHRPDTDQALELRETLRWWLFHESPVPMNEERAILWVRADLVNSGGTNE